MKKQIHMKKEIVLDYPLRNQKVIKGQQQQYQLRIVT